MKTMRKIFFMSLFEEEPPDPVFGGGMLVLSTLSVKEYPRTASKRAEPSWSKLEMTPLVRHPRGMQARMTTRDAPRQRGSL